MALVCGSRIDTSVCGIGWPMVLQMSSKESLGRIMLISGEVSVSP